MLDVLCKIPLIDGTLRSLFGFVIRMEIYERRGDAIVKKMDWGRRVRSKQGTDGFKILFEKSTIEPPKYKNYIIDKKGKPILMLFKATSGEYRPFNTKSKKKMKYYSDIDFTTEKDITRGAVTMKAEVEGLDLSVKDKDVLFWFVQEHRRNRERFFKPKWYELYAPYIVLAVAGVLMIIMITTVSKNLVSMSGQLNGVAQAINQAADTFKEALTTGQNIRPP